MIRGMRVPALVLASIAAVMLAGCSSKPVVTVDTESAATATYSSRVEAAAKMKTIYSRYMVALAGVVQSGGDEAENLRPFLTAAQYGREKQSMDAFAASGRHVVGAARVKTFQPQQIDLKSGSATVYVCIDVSQSKVKDKSGRDVTSKTRTDLQSLVVGFDRGPLIRSSKTWSGDGVC